MKILIATPLYPPEIGGPSTYVKELAERIKNTHKVTIVAYANTGEAIKGVKLILVRKKNQLFIRLIKYFIALYKESAGVDVIYAQNAVASGFPAVIVGKIRNIPVVIKFVGDEAWERASQLRQTNKKLEDFLEKPEGNLKIKILMKIQRFSLQGASLVTTPSVYLGKAITKTYKLKDNKVVVNYNVAEKTEILPFEAKVNPHQIVVTARLVEWKGIDGIIRAVSILKNDYPDVKLIIAGDGPEEKNLKELTRKLNLEDNVNFLGRVSRAETWHIRKQSAVYVLNSTYEGLPHTALTTFAAEIPIVATNISGTNEAVYHEKTGLLVEPGDDAGLANAIKKLFEDKDLCKRLVEGASKIMKEKFSLDAHINKFEEILNSVVSKPRN